MELIFTSKKDNENRAVEVSSVGFDLENHKVYVWGGDAERVFLDTDQADFVLVVPGNQGGDENE